LYGGPSTPSNPDPVVTPPVPITQSTIEKPVQPTKVLKSINDFDTTTREGIKKYLDYLDTLTVAERIQVEGGA